MSFVSSHKIPRNIKYFIIGLSIALVVAAFIAIKLLHWGWAWAVVAIFGLLTIILILWPTGRSSKSEDEADEDEAELTLLKAEEAKARETTKKAFKVAKKNRRNYLKVVEARSQKEREMMEDEAEAEDFLLG